MNFPPITSTINCLTIICCFNYFSFCNLQLLLFSLNFHYNNLITKFDLYEYFITFIKMEIYNSDIHPIDIYCR